MKQSPNDACTFEGLDRKARKQYLKASCRLKLPATRWNVIGKLGFDSVFMSYPHAALRHAACPKMESRFGITHVYILIPAPLATATAVFSSITTAAHGNTKVFNVNTVDLAARCAAALGASKLVYIADGSHLEDTITGTTDLFPSSFFCTLFVCTAQNVKRSTLCKIKNYP